MSRNDPRSGCILAAGAVGWGEMARRRSDLQILWVVLFAAVFWAAIWEHERLYELYRKSPVPGWLRHGASNGD